MWLAPLPKTVSAVTVAGVPHSSQLLTCSVRKPTVDVSVNKISFPAFPSVEEKP